MLALAFGVHNVSNGGHTMAPQLLANARWPSQAQEMETLPPAEKRRHSREWPTNAFAVPKVVVRQFGGLWPLPYWICAKCCVWGSRLSKEQQNCSKPYKHSMPKMSAARQKGSSSWQKSLGGLHTQLGNGSDAFVVLAFHIHSLLQAKP